MAVIESIWCAGQTHGKSAIAVSSTDCQFSRREQILDASVASLIMFFDIFWSLYYFVEMNIATSTLLYWFFESWTVFPNLMSIFTFIKNHILIYSNVFNYLDVFFSFAVNSDKGWQ